MLSRSWLIPGIHSRLAAGDIDRPLGLTRWFALLSFVCIATLSVISSILLSRFLADNMLRHDADILMDVVQSIVEVRDPRAYFLGTATDARPGLQEFVVHIAGLPDVLRANIYARDQRVLWSSDASLIGRKLGPNHELEEALEGKVEIESGVIGPDDPKPEHSHLKGRTPRYVENYLPVRASAGGPVIGVVELYRVPTALFDAVERGLRLIWISALGAGALLYLVLFGLVRRADRLLETQRERLLEAETLAVIGEMTGAITHGIRNPLASIRSSAELLQDDGSAEVRGTAHDIVNEVDRLSEWVRQLLTYSDQQPARLQTVDVAEVMRACLDGFGREMQRSRVALDFDAGERPANARAEPVRLAHVFNSVIANALEAMPKGGRLTVRVAQPRQEVVQVTVHDSGAGIPEHELPRVFVPFFTTKRKGLGLGLPLVKRIVTRFGGSVAMTSAAGEGTTVAIELPVH